MPNSFWQYDIFDPRKRGRGLSLRAPDDPLAYEDGGPPIVRSPAVDERIADYFTAVRDGDAVGRTRAMNAIIDLNRADHAVSGIPAYSHTPLPDDFVDQIVEPLLKVSTDLRSPVVESILEDADPDRRPIVRNQLDHKLFAAKAAVEAMMPESSDDLALDLGFGKELAFFSDGNGATSSSDLDALSEGGANRVAFAGGNQPVRSQQQPERIVKPYRRYASPGGVGAVDTEFQEADAIARDADVTIRKLTRKVLGNPQVEQSNDPFMREFARAVRRYYAEGGDRAVAAVAPRLKELSIDAEDQYASYSAYYDRIYFTRLNRHQSDEEKIITIIHEVLHATTTMKNRAAAVGYDKAPKGSIVRAKHEADVDNIAKQIAKKLGLIPQNYPPTDWRSYYKR